MKKATTTMVPVRLTESDLRTLDAAVNLQKAVNAFTPNAWARVTRSSVIRNAIKAEQSRLREIADAKEPKGPRRRYSERKKRKDSK